MGLLLLPCVGGARWGRRHNEQARANDVDYGEVIAAFGAVSTMLLGLQSQFRDFARARDHNGWQPCSSGTGVFDGSGCWWPTPWLHRDGQTAGSSTADYGADCSFKLQVDAATAAVKRRIAQVFHLEGERSLGSMLGHHLVRSRFRSCGQAELLRRAGYLAKSADSFRHLWAGLDAPGDNCWGIAGDVCTFLESLDAGTAADDNSGLRASAEVFVPLNICELLVSFYGDSYLSYGPDERREIDDEVDMIIRERRREILDDVSADDGSHRKHRARDRRRAAARSRSSSSSRHSSAPGSAGSAVSAHTSAVSSCCAADRCTPPGLDLVPARLRGSLRTELPGSSGSESNDGEDPRHIVHTEAEIAPGSLVELTTTDVCRVIELNVVPGHAGIWPISVEVAGCGDQLAWRDDVVLHASGPGDVQQNETAQCEQQ